MEGKTYAFADALDAAFTGRVEMFRLFRRQIPIAMLTNLASLFNLIVQSLQTTERRLMIALATTRETYYSYEIDDIGCIGTNANILDAFTKSELNLRLELLLDIGRFDQEILQCIIREKGNLNVEQTDGR